MYWVPISNTFHSALRTLLLPTRLEVALTVLLFLCLSVHPPIRAPLPALSVQAVAAICNSVGAGIAHSHVQSVADRMLDL